MDLSSNLPFNETIHSTSEKITRKIGFEFGKKLTGGLTIALNGNLGSGKTVFIQGLAKGLGIQTIVTSPTFTIVQQYKGKQWDLYHIDLYRLVDDCDAQAFGIEDFLGASNAITVIEWACRAKNLLNRDCIDIRIDYESFSERTIQIRRNHQEIAS